MIMIFCLRGRLYENAFNANTRIATFDILNNDWWFYFKDYDNGFECNENYSNSRDKLEDDYEPASFIKNEDSDANEVIIFVNKCLCLFVRT